MDDARLMLTDETWDRLAAALAEVKSRAGAPPKQSDRDFIEAVLHVARTGEPWRDLPERFGDWNTTFQRFNRWAKSGVWARVMEALGGDADLEHLLIDSTIIRAHQHSAGAGERGGIRPSAARAGG